MKFFAHDLKVSNSYLAVWFRTDMVITVTETKMTCSIIESLIYNHMEIRCFSKSE